MKKLFQILTLTLIATVFSHNTWAQTTVTLGGGATVTCPATPTATWTTPPAGCSFSNISRGSGVTCASASNGFSGSGFNASGFAASYTANTYYAVTITADATHNVTLNGITWLTAVSGSAGTTTVFTVRYNNNGGGLNTFGTASQTVQTTNSYAGSVTIAAGTSMIVYLIPSNAAASTGTVRVVNGSTFTVTSTVASGGTPTIVQSSPSQIAAANVTQGTVDLPISNFQAAVTVSTASLNSVSVNLGGTYGTSDLTNFKLWYNGTSNTFSGATQLGSTVTTIPASGSALTFTGLSQAIASGSTGYFWITASVSTSGTLTKTFSAGASPTLTFASGTPTGSITAGGAQTIVAPTNYYWNGSNTSALSSTWDNSTTNWTSPTASASLNATWPTQPAAAYFNGAGGGTVTINSTLNGLPTQINIGSSTYTFAGNAPVLSSPISLGGNTLTFSPTTTGTLNSIISGTGSMVYNGTGTTTITSATTSTYTGSTSITAGVLVIGADANLGTAPASATPANIVIDGGARLTAPGFTLNANRGIAVGNNAANSISITSASTTYNGIIADRAGSTPGTWAKQGAGTLILGGNSTYTGITSLNNGITQITVNNALPTTTTLNLGQSASTNLGTFDLFGHTQSVVGLNSVAGTGTAGSNTITSTNGASTLTITGSGSYSYGVNTTSNTGIISGAVSLIMNGSGSQTLGNTNTYTGTTTVSAGTLFINGATSSSSAVSIGSAGTLGGNGTAAGTVSLSGIVSPGSAASTVGTLTTGAFTFNTNSTYKFEISNAGGIAGTGYDAIVSTGAITCPSGTVNVDITSLTGISFNNQTSYSWTIASGTSISGFVANNFHYTTTNFTPSLGGGSLQFAQVGNTIVLKFIPVVPALSTSPTALTGFNYVAGFGPSTAQSFTVSGANLTGFPGTITIAGSTDFEISTTSATTGFGATASLSFTSASAISPNTVWVRLKSGLAAGSYTAESISIYGGGVSSGTPATMTVSGSVTAAYYWNGSTTSGTGTLVGGAGTWSTTATNWLSSPTSGTYVAWPNTASTNAYFTTGPGLITQSTTINANNEIFSVSGFGLYAGSTSQNNYGNIVLSGTNIGFNLNPANSSATFYQYGNITSTDGPSGSNTLTMTNAASGYNEVSMSLANSSISAPIILNLGSGTTTVLTGLVSKAAGVTMTGNLTINGTVGSARAMLGSTSGNSFAISGLISGTGDIQFSSGSSGGAGTVTLSNTGNSFVGNLYMVGATSGKFVASTGLGACVPSTMGLFYPTNSQGGVFDLGGSNVTLSKLSQTNSLAVGGITNSGSSSATLTVNQTGSSTFGPLVISNGTSAINLEVASGTLTLIGANTYTGITIVSGGGLFVNATSGIAAGSAVSVLAAGTLGGSGSILGSVSNSGIVSPGAAVSPSVGKLTTGAFTFNSGAKYKFDITAATGTAGTNWDLLNSTGAITFAAGNYTIDITGNPTGFSNTTPYTWIIASGTSINGFSLANFTLSTTNFTASFTGSFAVSQSGNNIVLTYTPALNGSLTGNGPFCGSGTAQLTWTATAGVGPYTIFYDEGGYTTNTVNNVISGVPFTTLINPINTSITSITYTIISITDNTTGTVKYTSDLTSPQTQITVNPIPTASISGTATGCGSVSLTASGGTSYAWSGGSSPSTAINTFTNSGTYTVTVTNSSGCTATASQSVTVNPVPTASISGTSIGCGSVSLTASGGTSYAWSGGTSTTTASNSFNSSGTYTVTVTSNACTATASQVVTVNPIPSASISGTATGCGSVSLTASGGTSYAWSGGSSPSTATNTFTTSNTYTLSVTDGNSCTASTNVPVTVNAIPSVVITNPTAVCAPGTVDLTAAGVTAGSTSGLTYIYFTNAAATATYGSPSAAAVGTYYIKGSTSAGCYQVQPVVVSTNPVPTATASNTGPYIPGQTISLSAGPSGQTTYAWSGPQSYTASTQTATRANATALMSGTYTVTVTNSSGCSATTSTFVSVNALGDYVWTGAVSTNWTTPGNWSPASPAGGPNGCTQNVIIPNTVNDPVISSAVSIGNVTINDNAQLTLNGNLSVCQNFTGGTTAPVLIVGTAHLIMSGSAYQAMSGTINANYVEINNTSSVGVGSTATLTINKGLIQTKGIFANQGGSTTLVSNAGGDAYLDNFTSSTAGPYHGNLTVQRYISNTADGYRDLSSSVGATVANLNNAFPVFGQNNVHCWYSYTPYPNVQTYVENQIIATGNFYEHWNSYTSLSGQLYAMRGYSARTYVGAPYTINLTGLLYANNESATITHTTSSTPGSDGWNFIGNPYPSPIKWSAVKAMNGAVTNGSYYVYHTTAEYAGNWASFNGTTGVNGATDYIASSQGFFIQTATASSTFSMNNSVRTIAPASFFSVNRAQDNEVRLLLDNGVNNDEIVSYTDANATAGFDADLDAEKMPSGSTVSIGYSLSGKEYAINVMDVLTPQTVLPLAITVRDTGSYTLSATTLNTPGLTAYLHDAVTGTLTDLSAGAVQMKLNGGQNYSGRYSVVFRAAAATGIANTVANTTRIYSYGSKVYVQRSSASAATITVTNLLGQQIKELPSNTEMTIFDMPTSQPWYALIKVTEGEKTTVAKVLLTNN